MHHHIITALVVLLALALSACGSRSRTVADFEADHPHSKQTMEIPAITADHLSVREYVDHVPSFGPDGQGEYRRERTVTLIAFDADEVIRARSSHIRWEDEQPDSTQRIIDVHRLLINAAAK